MENLWDVIGIQPLGALGVVIAATVIYFVFGAVVTWWWRHFRTSNSAFAFALTVILGSLMARSILGDTPTLAGGLIALATLLILEAVMDRLQLSARLPGAPGQPAHVVMVGGTEEAAVLRQHGIRSSQVYVALRRAGIRSDTEVGAVILEGDGSFTVLRAGEQVDANLLVGVSGVDKLPAGMVRG